MRNQGKMYAHTCYSAEQHKINSIWILAASHYLDCITQQFMWECPFLNLFELCELALSLFIQLI